MAISVNLLTEGSSTTDSTSYTTASISPTAGALVLAFVASGDTDGASTAPEMSGGGMDSWVRFADVQQGSGNQRVDVLRATDSSPGSGTCSISFGATTVENCAWTIIEVTGVVTTGTAGSDGIVQVKEANDSGSDVLVDLDNAVRAGNATFGIATGNTNSPTWGPGAGFVQIGSGWDMGTPSNKGIVIWDVDGGDPIQFENDGTPLCALAGFEVLAIQEAEAALTGTGSLSGDATLTAQAASALTGSGDLSALGVVVKDAEAALSGTGSLSAVGSAERYSFRPPVRSTNPPVDADSEKKMSREWRLMRHFGTRPVGVNVHILSDDTVIEGEGLWDITTGPTVVRTFHGGRADAFSISHEEKVLLEAAGYTVIVTEV